MDDRLPHKGYGRLYVNEVDDIEKVKNVIRELDEYEFDNYYPEGLVDTVSAYPQVVYVGKFEIDIPKLLDICAMRQIGVVCYNSGTDDKPWGYYKRLDEDDVRKMIEDSKIG